MSDDGTMVERVAAAIMRAYFDRPIDEQTGINVSIPDQMDLARAAIEETLKAIREPMSDEMIKRVAQIIRQGIYGCYNDDEIVGDFVGRAYGDEDDPEDRYDNFMRIARLAIEAMREPTEEMTRAGAYGSGEDSKSVANGAWYAMIDAALGQKE